MPVAQKLHIRAMRTRDDSLMRTAHETHKETKNSELRTRVFEVLSSQFLAFFGR